MARIRLPPQEKEISFHTARRRECYIFKYKVDNNFKSLSFAENLVKNNVMKMFYSAAVLRQYDSKMSSANFFLVLPFGHLFNRFRKEKFLYSPLVFNVCLQIIREQMDRF